MKADEDRDFVEAALAASDDCIKIIGLDGTLQYMSDGGKRVMEVDDFDAIRGCPWPDFWHDQGNVAAVAAVANAAAGRSARFTGYASTARGNLRYWDVKVSPILGHDGSVKSILSVSRDITALKQFEDQQALLRDELNHRIKNLLAMVQGIAGQTFKNDVSMAEAKAAFSARLAALASAHDLLTQAGDTAITLRAVADTVAEAQLAGRIVIEGPHVDLSAKGGLAVALALHELTTNAVKYGALSNDDGQVAIVWSIENVDDDAQLKLTWTESSGPPVKEPGRKGFGSLMIERALKSYIGGRAEVLYRPAGVVFQLSAPLENLKAN